MPYSQCLFKHYRGQQLELNHDPVGSCVFVFREMTLHSPMQIFFKDCVDCVKMLQFLLPPHQCLPKGSKLLAITPADKAATGDETLVQPEIFRVNSPMDESQCMVQTWGIPWEPEKFVDEVVKAGHPMDMATFLLPRLQVLLDTYKRTNSCKRVDDRLAAVKFWLKRCNGAQTGRA